MALARFVGITLCESLERWVVSLGERLSRLGCGAPDVGLLSTMLFRGLKRFDLRTVAQLEHGRESTGGADNPRAIPQRCAYDERDRARDHGHQVQYRSVQRHASAASVARLASICPSLSLAFIVGFHKHYPTAHPNN